MLTQILLGSLTIVAMLSLLIYFCYVAPMLIEVRDLRTNLLARANALADAKTKRLEAGILAIANALAKAQDDLAVQAQSLRESESMFISMREYCWRYEEQLAALAETNYRPAPDASQSAVPIEIPDQEAQTRKVNF